ncbi:MAG: BON domain-containing protein [Candidatus Acidiferrales bacterium]
MNLTNKLTKWAGIAALASATLLMAVPGGFAASNTVPQQDHTASSPKYSGYLNKEVHHRLAMLPWYGVFDNLEYTINGNDVTLSGQVVRPSTKRDALASIKHIEGVGNVVDNITVLPPSGFDNQIRRAEYRAIFSEAQLSGYSMGVNPSIHIIVNNGHVTLVGYVDNETDVHLATLRANSVPNVFSVTNNLQVGQRG